MNYLTAPVNTRGRDFIVGDLHGAYSALKRLLDEACFHVELDRLFMVGDLIDRGPESEQCLQLLFEPWCYAVKGNHEQLFCDAVEHNLTWINIEDYWHEDMGGGWTKPWFKRSAPELKYWSKTLSKLPYVYGVEGNKSIKPFWVVHAELWSPSNNIDDSNVAHIVNNAEIEEINVFHWSRGLVKKGFLGNTTHLSGPVYCGHTPTPEPGLNRCGHVNIDAGAGIGKYVDSLGHQSPRLFLYCHTTGQGYHTIVHESLPTKA